MKLVRMTAATIIATTAILLNADPAEASGQRCQLIAQPWDGRSYALTAVVDGTPTPLITRQSGMLDGQTAWEFDADAITEVWWAAKNPALQASAADFYDVLPVADCRFTVAYHATPGKPDSVAISALEAPPVTTLPPTTTTQPAPPPTIVQRETPTPEAAPPVSTTVPPTVDEPPTTTAPTPNPPAVSVPSPPDTTVELFEAAPPVTYGQAGNPDTLPVTGRNPMPLVLFGLALMLPGTLLAGLSKLRARTIRTNQENQ